MYENYFHVRNVSPHGRRQSNARTLSVTVPRLKLLKHKTFSTTTRNNNKTWREKASCTTHGSLTRVFAECMPYCSQLQNLLSESSAKRIQRKFSRLTDCSLHFPMYYLCAIFPPSAVAAFDCKNEQLSTKRAVSKSIPCFTDSSEWQMDQYTRSREHSPSVFYGQTRHNSTCASTQSD